jgi:hypothetical protein
MDFDDFSNTEVIIFPTLENARRSRSVSFRCALAGVSVIAVVKVLI